MYICVFVALIERKKERERERKTWQTWQTWPNTPMGIFLRSQVRMTHGRQVWNDLKCILSSKDLL